MDGFFGFDFEFWFFFSGIGNFFVVEIESLVIIFITLFFKFYVS